MNDANSDKKLKSSNNKRLNMFGLLKEFCIFRPDKQFSSMDGKKFARALAKPQPEFVASFIKTKTDYGYDRNTAIRDLYAFLLEKRYYSKINLLYFAFDIFCDKEELDDGILNITPLPHEDGTPLFKYRLLPDFNIEWQHSVRDA